MRWKDTILIRSFPGSFVSNHYLSYPKPPFREGEFHQNPDIPMCGVVQAYFGENRLHGTSVSGRLTSDFETKDPGNELIGSVDIFCISKNKNRLSIRKVAAR